jgi:membrane protease YdiL (CAAX protease family)
MRSSAVTSSGWRSSKPRAFMFTWASFVLSSVPFGLLHGRHWLPGVLAGMLFALAVYRRGRPADPEVARVTANTLVAVTVLLTGNWGLWA